MSWIDVEKSIRTILDMLELLQPISVRVILNRNMGKAEADDLMLYYCGKTNPSFEAIDSRFYSIMKTQKNVLRIPSIGQSILLSSLSINDGSAVFVPLRTSYGYAGFLWSCFENTAAAEKASDIILNCCESIELRLQRRLDNDLQTHTMAKHFTELLEKLKLPALILLLPDRVLVSNPSFEALKDKDAILNAIRGENDEADKANLLSGFDYIRKTVDFGGNKSGRVFVFPQAEADIREARFGENEIMYYRLLTEKALGSVALLESSGDFTNLQKGYIDKTVSPLQRLGTLFDYGANHYRGTENSTRSFEVVSVTKLTREIVYDLSPAARNKRVEIEMNATSGESGHVNGKAVGDPWLLSLAIFNLINNAVNASKMDGKPIFVSIKYNETDWTLRVEDFGNGISPLDLEKLQEQTDLDAAGNGIRGLSLVKYTAKVHNGKLLMESRLGKGSAFTLVIPYY